MKDDQSIPLTQRWASEKTPIRILDEGEGEFVPYEDLPYDDEEDEKLIIDRGHEEAIDAAFNEWLARNGLREKEAPPVIPERVTAFAKAQGYDGALPFGTWRGYEVYEPIFAGESENDFFPIGPPFVILVQGETIRMSTEEEAFQRIDERAKDD